MSKIKTNPKSQDLLFIIDEITTSTNWDIDYEKNQVKPVLKKALDFLNEYENGMRLACNYQLNGTVGILSSRQLLLSQLVLEYLSCNRITNAYHELSDCIDDYGRGRMYNSEININEYVLYKSLITFFIYVLEQREQDNLEILSNWEEDLDINKHESYRSAPYHDNFRHRVASYMKEYELSFDNVLEEIKTRYKVEYMKEDIIKLIDGSCIAPDLVWILADLFGFDIASIHSGYLQFDNNCPNIDVIIHIMMKHVRVY